MFMYRNGGGSVGETLRVIHTYAIGTNRPIHIYYKITCLVRGDGGDAAEGVHDAELLHQDVLHRHLFVGAVCGWDV